MTYVTFHVGNRVHLVEPRQGSAPYRTYCKIDFVLPQFDEAGRFLNRHEMTGGGIPMLYRELPPGARVCQDCLEHFN